jgi:nucleotide-binding universal stress UspA family protein
VASSWNIDHAGAMTNSPVATKPVATETVASQVAATGGLESGSVVAVGVDGSPSSAQALAWAASEATQRGCGLRVVHAFSVPVYGGGFGSPMPFSSDEIVDLHVAHEHDVVELVRPLRETYPDLNIETFVEVGTPTDTLMRYADDAELTVVGSRGAGTLSSLLLGSVSHSVAHRSRCPVVLVPDGCVIGMVQRVVVGTDGSPPAQRAVQWAADEAARWNAELVVVHAWEYPYLGKLYAGRLPAHLMESDAADLLATVVDGLGAERGTATAIHSRLVCGSASSALSNEARDGDLLVVGARGRGVLGSALLGSVSNRVIHHAHCPVVVVHNPVP